MSSPTSPCPVHSTSKSALPASPMLHTRSSWDYLIVTASNDAQARAYESQLELRHRLGLLPGVRHVMVVADPQGRRVGSGGSTLCCLIDVVNREVAAGAASGTMDQVEAILRKLRVLIIHAGGDSRRLPAYGPCGKIFIPVPGQGDAVAGCALFDRIAPGFMNLPRGCDGQGQVVITAGDALILFDPSNVSLAHPGMTALACPDTPEHASKHGVFCSGSDGLVRLYLQKPGPAEQQKQGAINADGRALLDIGVMSFDSTMSMAMLRAYGIRPGTDGRLDWPADVMREVLEKGVDFFREICCAMGSETTAAHHYQQARSAGCNWSEASMLDIFKALSGVPFHLEAIPQARFLHFGTTRQLITSGAELRQHDTGAPDAGTPLMLDNKLIPGAAVSGTKAWVEGCRIAAPVRLGGNNVLIGVEISQSLDLPANACLDVLSGRARDGRRVWYSRGYGITDTFKDTISKGGTFCGKPLMEWLSAVGARPGDIWDESIPENQRSLWDARVFPAMNKPDEFGQWLWVFDPEKASSTQKRAFLEADRYSAAEVAVLADQNDFFASRQKLRQ